MLPIEGIVRMEPLDFLTDLYSEDRRETGDVRAFDSKLIPLQMNSYLGPFQVRSFFIHSIINGGLR